MIQDVLHNPSDHKWWKSFKPIDSRKHLWFWKLNNFFVLLLTIKALCPTVHLQKLNAFVPDSGLLPSLRISYGFVIPQIFPPWKPHGLTGESVEVVPCPSGTQASNKHTLCDQSKKQCTHIIAGSNWSAGSLSLLSRSRWLDNRWWVPSPTSPRLNEVGSPPGSTHYMPVFAFCLTCLLYRREPASQDKKTLAWENVRSLPDPARSLPLHSWDTISTWKKPMKQTIFDSPFSSGYTHWHYICWA